MATRHICSACTASFPSGQAFNAHAPKCPATVPPNHGESWADYEKRANEASAAWRAANGKTPATPSPA